MSYKEKYLKYKTKYLNLQSQLGRGYRHPHNMLKMVNL